MEIKIGDDWCKIDNDHSADMEDIFNALDRQVKNMYLASHLAKGDKFTSDDDGKKETVSYTKNEIVARVLYELFFLIAHSSTTVLKLKDLGGLHLVHGTTIARSIVEASINAAYIMSSDEAVAEQALAHAFAKSYHSLERNSGKGPHRMKIKKRLGIKPSEKFLEMLNGFTSAKGRPLNWTQLSVTQRIDEIQKVFGTTIAVEFNAAYINIYQDASEVLHGSYLGALISHDREPFKKAALKLGKMNEANELRYSATLSSLFLSVDALLKAFCKYTEIDKDFFELEALFRSFVELMFGESFDDVKKKNESRKL